MDYGITFAEFIVSLNAGVAPLRAQRRKITDVIAIANSGRIL